MSQDKPIEYFEGRVTELIQTCPVVLLRYDVNVGHLFLPAFVFLQISHKSNLANFIEGRLAKNDAGPSGAIPSEVVLGVYLREC